MKTIKTFSLSVISLALVFSYSSGAMATDSDVQEAKRELTAAPARYRGCNHISPTECKKLFLNEEVYQQVLNKYGSVRKYTNHLIQVRGDRGEGLIDSSGEIVLPLEYSFYPTLDTRYDIPKQVVTISKDDKYGLLNKLGEIVLPIKYDRIEEIDAEADYFYALELADKYGLANKYGEIILPALYDSI
ncbi:MAG: WG repeat-containing protein, partial [Psychrobacter sp.]